MKCQFKVKHTTTLFQRKRTAFFNIFIPELALFAHCGAQLFSEGTKFAMGHLYALMEHFALHIRVIIGTVELQGKLSQRIIIFAPNGAQFHVECANYGG